MKIINDLQQGSADWLAMRRGKITMSRAKDLLTGGKGVTRTSYLQEVAAEQLSSDMGDHFMSRDMVRGTELESFAVQAYETVMNSTVQRVGFVLHEDERIGCSPDGLTKNGGIEIKCPLPKNHLKYASLTNVEKEHGAQMQGVMWICEREHLDFVSFCPWVETCRSSSTGCNATTTSFKSLNSPQSLAQMKSRQWLMK